MNFVIGGGILAFVLVVMAAMLYHTIGALIFLPFLLILLWIAGFFVKGKMRSPEEIAFEAEEKGRLLQERLEEDQKWFSYLAGTTCILCGKTKNKGANLCDNCCPLCGQKKTRKALICKNCLKQLPRDDLHGLSQGGVPTKREIRVAIYRANIPGRVQRMLEAAEKGEVIEYGVDMGVEAGAVEEVDIDDGVLEEDDDVYDSWEEEENGKGEDVKYQVKGGDEEISGSGAPEQW